jgi:hypothetical protein
MKKICEKRRTQTRVTIPFLAGMPEPGRRFFLRAAGGGRFGDTAFGSGFDAAGASSFATGTLGAAGNGVASRATTGPLF